MSGGRQIRPHAALLLGALALPIFLPMLARPAVAAQPRSSDPLIAGAIRHHGTTIETVTFGGGAVRVVRGAAVAAASRHVPRRHSHAPAAPAPTSAPAPAFAAQNIEIVSFSDGTGATVKIVRGAATAAAEPASIGDSGTVQTIRFADPRLPAVAVVRGIKRGSALALFDPADGADLDRVAFAVDGAESSHGNDLRMWRPVLTGPQGPMQVSAAAAFDVGGGDRFDERQNRVLGRAYLARMFERYGNWPDAIAAYNWGPGNMDAWIAGGRDLLRLPSEVGRYVRRVLRDAMMPAVASLRRAPIAASPPL